MRFLVGPIPSGHLATPSRENWTPLREPSSATFSVQVLLLSLPLLVASIWILMQLQASLRSHPAQLVSLLAFFALMVPFHELLHALAYPGGLRSKHLLMGAWPQRGLCYVCFDAPLRRNRILLMLITPFVVVSILLTAVIWLAPAEWQMLGLLALMVHTAICLGDFLTAIRILIQVPRCSQLQNDGWETYWAPMPDRDATA